MTVQEIIDYSMKKTGAYIEFPFGITPLCIKFLNKIAVQVYDDKITLKCEPAFGIPYRDKYEGTVIKGYHCPLVHQPYFNTIYLNGKMPADELKLMIDHAFSTIINKLPKIKKASIKLKI